MDTLATFDSKLRMYFNPKNLHLTYFWLLTPFVSLWILDEWMGICNRQVRIIVQRLKPMLLVACFPNCLYNAFYCFLYGMNATFEGRTHVVALMFIVLFVLMVAIDFRDEFDAKSGVLLMYFSASLSCFMLVSEQISVEAETMSFWFNAGVGSYIVGLLMVYPGSGGLML